MYTCKGIELFVVHSKSYQPNTKKEILDDDIDDKQESTQPPKENFGEKFAVCPECVILYSNFK